MHDPLKSVIVIDRVVLCTPIVPHGHRSRSPLEPTSKFWPCLVGEKIVKQRFAFCFGHIFKTDRMAIIHEQHFSTGFRMSAHDWVFSF